MMAKEEPTPSILRQIRFHSRIRRRTRARCKALLIYRRSIIGRDDGRSSRYAISFIVGDGKNLERAQPLLFALYAQSRKIIENTQFA